MKETTVTGLLEHECREAGLVEVVEVLLPLTCSAHGFPRRLEPWAGRTREERHPLVEALAHSSCPAPTHGEAPTDASYLGPVGPASHLLHDGLIGQPVVQPRYVLAIGPEEGAEGGEAMLLSCVVSPMVIRHLAQHLSTQHGWK